MKAWMQLHLRSCRRGLGIGIDYGTVALVDSFASLTVVGPAVVYACRFTFSPAGKTYLNEQAYRALR